MCSYNIFFIINDGCSFCVFMCNCICIFNVYIKEKMFKSEKRVSDPIAMFLDNKICLENIKQLIVFDFV